VLNCGLAMMVLTPTTCEWGKKLVMEQEEDDHAFMLVVFGLAQTLSSIPVSANKVIMATSPPFSWS
jgi:hypothetical protein